MSANQCSKTFAISATYGIKKPRLRVPDMQHRTKAKQAKRRIAQIKIKMYLPNRPRNIQPPPESDFLLLHSGQEAVRFRILLMSSFGTRIRYARCSLARLMEMIWSTCIELRVIMRPQYGHIPNHNGRYRVAVQNRATKHCHCQ